MKKQISDILLYNKNTYFILNELQSDNILDRCAEALSQNMSIIEFSPFESDNISVDLGHRIRQLCSIYNSLYIVKSRCDIAKITQADGVSLVENDVSINDAKIILHDDSIIGTYYYNSNSDFILSDTNLNGIKYLFIKKNNQIYEK